MAAKVKKGDRVVVLAGRDKGKQGEVTKVMPTEGRVIVSGVNVVTRHQKPNQMDPGGIKRFEAPIDVSNVSLLDPKDGKPTRVGFKIDEHGRKIRIAKRSGEAIDV
ncbi:MAG: 50S ribosomal protein L24 [Ponticaulis sp.]|nr:50S ribosomal protein L24 [Ponticaulis sp.]